MKDSRLPHERSLDQELQNIHEGRCPMELPNEHGGYICYRIGRPCWVENVRARAECPDWREYVARRF